MRFIKCLSVLSFAVGDREGYWTPPVEAELILSASDKPNERFFSACSFFYFSCLPASGVCRSRITSTLADYYSLYMKLIKYRLATALEGGINKRGWYKQTSPISLR